MEKLSEVWFWNAAKQAKGPDIYFSNRLFKGDFLWLTAWQTLKKKKKKPILKHEWLHYYVPKIFSVTKAHIKDFTEKVLTAYLLHWLSHLVVWKHVNILYLTWKVPLWPHTAYNNCLSMNSPEGQSTPEWITEFRLVIRNYLVHRDLWPFCSGTGTGPQAAVPRDLVWPRMLHWAKGHGVESEEGVQTQERTAGCARSWALACTWAHALVLHFDTVGPPGEPHAPIQSIVRLFCTLFHCP